MRFTSLRWLALLLCLAAVWAKAQQSQTLRIDKIDPPDWWTGLPSPMLLIHGQGLDQAEFKVEGKAVSIAKSQVSANGHWAFLWLDTARAAPQTLTITAALPNGQTKVPFTLAERSHDANAHAGFSSADVMYLIMTDRFASGDPAHAPPGENRTLPRGWHGGDFAGIEQHLNYLKDLGVTTVWTTPVASNGAIPQAYHGYAATDLYATDAHFGTLAQYRQLSDALHARGMKLVIDLVPNHVGVEHPWVTDPPTPDWFHGTAQQHPKIQFDFYNLVDPHAPQNAWYNITHGWFTDAMPDMNQENPLVAKYLIQNALWWVEKANLDGIRLDTFPYVGRPFWRDFHAALHEAYPRLTTVGEVFHADPQVTSFFAGGEAHRGIDTGLDTPFDFPVYFKLREVLIAGKPMTELKDLLRQDALYPHSERLVTFIGNHDTIRFVTAAGGSALKLKLALGLVLTLRGMPQIYSGDEIGMAGGEDPDNRRDFPGGFAVDKRSAFTSAGRTAEEEQVFAWTKGLLGVRATHPQLTSGIEQDLFADDNTFVFVRTQQDHGCSPNHDTEQLLIVVNKAPQSEPVDLPVEGTALAGCSDFRVVSPNMGAVPAVSNGKFHLQEPAQSLTVFAVR